MRKLYKCGFEKVLSNLSYTLAGPGIKLMERNSSISTHKELKLLT